MKVNEQEVAEEGGYAGRFKELISTGNKVGLKETKAGTKIVLFRLACVNVKTNKDADVPASFPFDFDDWRTKATLGALGVPRLKMKRIAKEQGTTKALIWFERVAAAKKMDLSVYVKGDAGFAGGIRPLTGKFDVIVARFLPRDEETDKPTLEFKKSKTIQTKKGGTYKTPEGYAFSAVFEVVEGPNKGASFTKSYMYAIVKDEDDEWVVDADSPQGREFKALCVVNKVNLDALEPDRDFKDPENGMPEIERTILKHGIVGSLTVEDGWAREYKKVPGGGTVKTEEAVEVQYKASVKLIGQLFEMIEKVVSKAAGIAAWQENGELTPAGKKWLLKNKFSTKFEVMTNENVRRMYAGLKAKLS